MTNINNEFFNISNNSNVMKNMVNALTILKIKV